MTGAPARLGGPRHWLWLAGTWSRFADREKRLQHNAFGTASGLDGDGRKTKRAAPHRPSPPRFRGSEFSPDRGLDTPPVPGEVLLNPLRSRRCCPTSQLAVCSRPTVVKVAAGVRYAACRGRSVRDYCAVLPPLSRMICPLMTLTPRTHMGRRRRSRGVVRPTGEGCRAGLSALFSSAPVRRSSMAVCPGPGAMALTRTPVAAPSGAAAVVSRPRRGCSRRTGPSWAPRVHPSSRRC
ncbi:MAG: hypothetical protein QOC69_339 [Mycobacterium sp.]|nr:hypothetical protein [Mycobacterium sp.]